MSAARRTEPAADGLPPRERALAMLAIQLGVAMASLDTAIANTALPAIAQQLHASPSGSVWIVSVYQLSMVATLLPLAALGERIGYRVMCLAGMAVFTLASLGCAAAWSLPSLVAGRLLQGLGASALMSVNGALLRMLYPAHLRGRGFGTNALVVAVAFAAGPSLASVILAWGSWPWLFGMNVPLGAAAVLLGLRTLPAAPARGGRPDLIAMAYNVGGFGMLILALGDAAHFAGTARIAVEFAIAVVLVALLAKREAGQAAPMLPVDLFRRPLFALSSLTSVCTFATQSLAFVSLPFYLEAVMGRSTVETGFLMTPWPVLVGVMAPIAGRLSDRYPAGLLGGVGLAVLAAGMAALFALPAHATGVDIGWRMALCGTGFGFFQAPNLKAIMGSAPAERSGGASGVIALSRLTGQSTGAALVALCLSMAGRHGAGYALVLGGMFAMLGSVVSFMRLIVPGSSMEAGPIQAGLSPDTAARRDALRRKR